MASSTGKAREWGNVVSTNITPLRSHRGKVNRGVCTGMDGMWKENQGHVEARKKTIGTRYGIPEDNNRRLGDK